LKLNGTTHFGERDRREPQETGLAILDWGSIGNPSEYDAITAILLLCAPPITLFYLMLLHSVL
jgi:hypothetical protein